MDITAILALVVSGLVFLYTIFKDNSKEQNELKERVSDLSTAITVHETLIDRLDKEQIGLQKRMEILESQIHEVNRKLERVLTILENKQ